MKNATIEGLEKQINSLTGERHYLAEAVRKLTSEHLRARHTALMNGAKPPEEPKDLIEKRAKLAAIDGALDTYEGDILAERRKLEKAHVCDIGKIVAELGTLETNYKKLRAEHAELKLKVEKEREARGKATAEAMLTGAKADAAGDSDDEKRFKALDESLKHADKLMSEKRARARNAVNTALNDRASDALKTETRLVKLAEERIADALFVFGHVAGKTAAQSLVNSSHIQSLAALSSLPDGMTVAQYSRHLEARARSLYEGVQGEQIYQTILGCQHELKC